MVKINSHLETLRRINRSLEGPLYPALLFTLLGPALPASPFLDLLGWLAKAVVLAWFVSLASTAFSGQKTPLRHPYLLAHLAFPRGLGYQPGADGG